MDSLSLWPKLYETPLSLRDPFKFSALFQTDEEVYHSQLQLIARLLNHLTKIDADKGNQGTLTKEEFKAALQEYFNTKSEADIESLCKEAEVDLEARDSDSLDYKSLFMEVRESYQCSGYFRLLLLANRKIYNSYMGTTCNVNWAFFL